MRLAIAWYDDENDLARDAYDFAWHHPDFAPDVPASFSAWIGEVARAWAAQTAEARGAWRATHRLPRPSGRAKPRTYKITLKVVATIDAARGEDSRRHSGPASRAAWVREALAWQMERSVEHNGGSPLPHIAELNTGNRTDTRPTRCRHERQR